MEELKNEIASIEAENETALGKEVNLIQCKAASVVITNESDYSFAGEMTRNVKTLQKQVKDYWEPVRVAAKKTYDDILAKKKEMLDPLEAAEKILKSKMGGYLLEVEKKRREQEEAMKRLAQQEVEKKLEEAVTAEKNGDAIGCEMAMTEAEIMADVANSGMVPKQKVKAEGVSNSKSWEIVSIDSKLVPIDFAGMEIRPVDEKLVMQLIKASKGTIKIPGIEYKETVTLSVRSK